MPTPSGIVMMRPGIGTNEPESVECVPLVCAYKFIFYSPVSLSRCFVYYSNNRLKVATEFAAIKTREGENGRWREAFEVVALRDR
jgi:hypothetical protein